MLHILNQIEPEAWVGLAGLLGGIGAAIAAARSGARKSPPEVGHGPPETDRTEYVLGEVRKANAQLARMDERLEDVDYRTESMKADLRVLLDRR